jgi:hypothetical protein
MLRQMVLVDPPVPPQDRHDRERHLGVSGEPPRWGRQRAGRDQAVHRIGMHEEALPESVADR